MSNPNGWIWAVCCGYALAPLLLALGLFRYLVHTARRFPVLTRTQDKEGSRIIQTFRLEMEERQRLVRDETQEENK